MSNHEAVCDLMAENGRLQAENAALIEALEPFAYATVTPNGEIIGLMREHINAARAVLTSIGRTK